MIEKSKITNLLCRLLDNINSATNDMETEDTDSGVIHYPNFRYMPTFEFEDDDIELIKELEAEEGVDFTNLTE